MANAAESKRRIRALIERCNQILPDVNDPSSQLQPSSAQPIDDESPLNGAKKQLRYLLSSSASLSNSSRHSSPCSSSATVSRRSTRQPQPISSSSKAAVGGRREKIAGSGGGQEKALSLQL